MEMCLSSSDQIEHRIPACWGDLTDIHNYNYDCSGLILFLCSAYKMPSNSISSSSKASCWQSCWLCSAIDTERPRPSPVCSTHTWFNSLWHRWMVAVASLLSSLSLGFSGLPEFTKAFITAVTTNGITGVRVREDMLLLIGGVHLLCWSTYCNFRILVLMGWDCLLAAGASIASIIIILGICKNSPFPILHPRTIVLVKCLHPEEVQFMQVMFL